MRKRIYEFVLGNSIAAIKIELKKGLGEKCDIRIFQSSGAGYRYIAVVHDQLC